ncbi:hypothetical protein BC629DRAFT_1438179 [Irpex lacteus]|nr:hypothetical protein BC629DRAFT_1438179 [Irpex lacteus]
MFFKSSILGFIVAAFISAGAASPTPAPAAIICATCPPTIVFEGVTRTITLKREEEGNTLQCNYDLPAIPDFSPGCLYDNASGELIFSNAGGACLNPAPTVVNTLGICLPQ